jgi:hypothetical protein
MIDSGRRFRGLGVSLLTYSAGRVIGLVFSLSAVALVGPNGYGVYAMAASASAVIASLIDGPLLSASLRATEAQHLSALRWRIWVSPLTVTLATAVMLTNPTTLLLAIAIGGYLVSGELLVGVRRSLHLRRGDTTGAQRIDLIRQCASTATALIAGSVSQDPRALAFGYLAGYLPWLVLTLGVDARALKRHGREHPFTARQWFALSTTGLAAGLYMQADVLVLGSISGPEPAGIYAILSLLAWAATAPAQQWASMEVPRWRSERDSLPSWRAAVGFGTVSALALALAAFSTPTLAGLLPSPEPYALLALAGFAVFRSMNWVLSTWLLVRNRDAPRMFGASLGAVVDLSLLALFVGWTGGVLAASVAAAVTEVFIFGVFGVAVRRVSAGARQ